MGKWGSEVVRWWGSGVVGKWGSEVVGKWGSGEVGHLAEILPKPLNPYLPTTSYRLLTPRKTFCRKPYLTSSPTANP
ncbi:MAG UNVERIFIED_CONTAM: hypothetical protein LVR29_26105 [Microcystis novacekii LVE1205-3]